MTIEKIAFGRTGHDSTRTLFGAAALSRVDQATADRTFDLLMQHGVNHIDTAASYGDAELRIAPWRKRNPRSFFVATKTGARRAAEAREELHRSLDRMGVDHVDLWQLHNLADPIDWDTALSPGGVIEAAVQAREEGLVRFIGVTGHGSQIAAVQGAQGGGADHQIDSDAAVERAHPHALDVVRATAGPGRHRPRGLVGAGKA